MGRHVKSFSAQPSMHIEFLWMANSRRAFPSPPSGWKSSYDGGPGQLSPCIWCCTCHCRCDGNDSYENGVILCFDNAWSSSSFSILSCCWRRLQGVCVLGTSKEGGGGEVLSCYNIGVSRRSPCLTDVACWRSSLSVRNSFDFSFFYKHV